MTKTTIEFKPLKPIRRFDVFAEVNRNKALSEGRPDNEARGYGIWLAKVVASRKSRSAAEGERTSETSAKRRKEDTPPQYHTIGDELQTEAEFDHEIVERMGVDFYQKVFSPAVKAALNDGQKYEQFRDSIRSNGKPEK